MTSKLDEVSLGKAFHDRADIQGAIRNAATGKFVSPHYGIIIYKMQYSSRSFLHLSEESYSQTIAY
jgi:hypothetical protein